MSHLPLSFLFLSLSHPSRSRTNKSAAWLNMGRLQTFLTMHLGSQIVAGAIIISLEEHPDKPRHCPFDKQVVSLHVDMILYFVGGLTISGKLPSFFGRDKASQLAARARGPDQAGPQMSP